jgi:transposase-like protein
MRWKKASPQEIVTKVARVTAAAAEGVQIADAARAEGISQATYFRWRALYRDMDAEQLGKLKKLQSENARLRRTLVEYEDNES